MDWECHILSLILGILIFIVLNFYVFSSIVSLEAFFYAFLLLSALTDGLYMFMHIPRKRRYSEKHKKTSLNPEKLTVLIAACRNGEDVIEETIHSAQRSATKSA